MLKRQTNLTKCFRNVDPAFKWVAIISVVGFWVFLLSMVLVGCSTKNRVDQTSCEPYWTKFNRPALASIKWTHSEDNKTHCLTTAEAKKLLNNLDAKDAYIMILEGRIVVMDKLLCPTSKKKGGEKN